MSEDVQVTLQAETVIVHVEKYATHRDYSGGSSFGGCKLADLPARIKQIVEMAPTAIIRIEPSAKLKAQAAANELAKQLAESEKRLGQERERVQALLDEAASEKHVGDIGVVMDLD